MKRSIQIMCLTAFFMSTAQADDCIENAQDQSEMNACAQMDYMAADAVLNQRYQALRQHVGETTTAHKLLADTEKKWIIFRDAECTFTVSKAADSSSYPMLYNECLTHLTQKRSEQLLQYLNEQEGSLSTAESKELEK